MAAGRRLRAGEAHRNARRGRGAMAAALLPLLAACGGGSGITGPLANIQAPCPRIAILADGADLTRFRPGAERDLTAMIADARVSGFEAQCDFASRDRRALNVRVTPRFEAERGPAAQGRVLDLGWFVALSDSADTAVLNRQAFTTRITFPPNVPRATVEGGTARLTLPLSETMRAVDYHVRISFQLTDEELALNRARGPR